MIELELWVPVEPLLAVFASPALGVVHAVVAHSAAHVPGGGVHVRVEHARVGVVVALAFLGFGVKVIINNLIKHKT